MNAQRIKLTDVAAGLIRAIASQDGKTEHLLVLSRVIAVHAFQGAGARGDSLAGVVMASPLFVKS
jgi:hypothetical protein